jgi:hypothetical protein
MTLERALRWTAGIDRHEMRSRGHSTDSAAYLMRSGLSIRSGWWWTGRDAAMGWVYSGDLREREPEEDVRKRMNHLLDGKALER